MKEQSSPLRTTKDLTPLRVTSMETIFQDMRDAFDAIARRAYEIFEANGRQFGRDMEDWFRAEHELMHPAYLEITESDNELAAKIEVPGFEAKELEISVGPSRVTLAGKHETAKEEKKEKTLYSERRANQIFRSFELPAEVDPERVTATLKDGVLDLKMPKAAAAKKIKVEPRAA
jgi:HSP20 family molecular chaperone IbpA